MGYFSKPTADDKLRFLKGIFFQDGKKQKVHVNTNITSSVFLLLTNASDIHKFQNFPGPFHADYTRNLCDKCQTNTGLSNMLSLHFTHLLPRHSVKLIIQSTNSQSMFS